MSAVGDAVIHYSAAPEPPIPAVSLSEHVLGAAPERGSAPAIIDGQTGAVTTYEQLARNVKSLSAGLAGAGAGPGTVLALMSPNRPEYPQVLYAASATGATVSPIGVLATEDDVARQLSDSRARVLVVAESLRDTAIAAAATAGVQGVYVIGEPGEARSLSELYGDPADAPRPHIDPATDVAALPYSSGTTGLSKGVMLSHRNLIANIEQLAGHHQITPSDVLLPAVPFFHIYGMNVVLGAGLAAGAALITLPRFDLDAFLTLIERHRVTRAFVAPPVVLQLASVPQVSRHDLSSLKFVMSGAAPLDEDLARRAEARIGCPIIQGYGMTEASPGTHGVPDEEAGDTPPSSVGRLVAGTEARIVDPATTEDINGRGEILIRGPQVMLGYHGQPAATAETIIEDGWLRTGDIGVVDERGDWYIVDRAKELIKYKGYQVPPAELEAVLLGHPSISDAAVIGVPDAAGGEAPKAFIVADGELDAETVMAWVAARVSPYKRVRHVELVAEIPKSPTGKILRRLLRDRTEAPTEPVHASQRKGNKMSTSPQTAPCRLVDRPAK